MTDTARFILPSNASPFERAHVDNGIAAWAEIDETVIETEGDPSLCDIALVPTLAVDKGITLWNDNWTDQRKRSVVANGWVYKLLEGTPLGAELYLNLADSMLVEEILPPNDSFLIPDTGVLSHQKVLDLMPQIRLYYHWPETEPSSNYLFIGRDAFGGFGSLISDQTGYLGRYPILYDPQTQESQLLDVDSFEQTSFTASLKGRDFAGGGFFLGGQSFFGRDLFGSPDLAEPITFDLADPVLATFRDSPPTRAAQDAIGQGFIGQTYFTDDIGDIGTYDRLYVLEPNRIPSGINGVRSAMFLGQSWFGIPAYTQILTAAVPGNPIAVPPLWGFLGKGFLIDATRHPQLDFALQAINRSKRAGDRVLLSLAPTFAGARAATLPAITDLSK